MNGKKQFMVLVLGVLALAIGLGADQASLKSCNPPQPQKMGGSFIPSLTTHLGYTASLILSGLPYPAGMGVNPKGDQVFVNTEIDSSIWRYQNNVLKLMQATSVEPLAGRSRGAYYYGDIAGNIIKGEDSTLPQFLGQVADTAIKALDVDPKTGIVYFIADHPTFVPYIAIFKSLPGNSTPVPLGYIFSPSWGLALKGNYLYFTYYASGEIYKVSKDGGPLIFVAGGLNGPTDIGFDSKGNMIVAEWNSGSIARVKAGSLAITRIATGAISPYYLQLDAADNIYFTDFNAGTLWKLKKH